MENEIKDKMYSSAGYQIICSKEYFNNPYSLLKIWFGKKFYIARAKSVNSFVDNLGKQIRTNLKKDELNDEGLLYHVVKHIRRLRPLNGTVEMIGSYDTALELMKQEQLLLDKNESDPMCLNNNEQAYVPIGNAFISDPDKQIFLKWYEKRKK